MSENGEKNIEDIEFTVKGVERNQKIFTRKKLNLDCVYLKTLKVINYLSK